MKKNKRALKPIDQPSYGYWQALYRSFYSYQLYVDVGKRWRGFGFLYLLLMVTVLTLPLSIKSMVYFNYFYNKQMIEPLEKMPTFYIQNGEVKLDKPMPYFIKGSAGEVLAIIDTSGTIKSMTPTYPDLTFLVTKNKIFMKTPTPPITYSLGGRSAQDTIEEQTLDENMNEVFNPQEWLKNSRIKTIKNLSLAVSPLVIIAFFFSMFAIFFPVLAFLGQLFAQVFFSFKLAFKASCRLMMVAVTPMMTLLMVLLTFSLTYTGTGLLLIALIAIYYSFAVIFLKRDSQTIART